MPVGQDGADRIGRHEADAKDAREMASADTDFFGEFGDGSSAASHHLPEPIARRQADLCFTMMIEDPQDRISFPRNRSPLIR
jgi:hypothetical protein